MAYGGEILLRPRSWRRLGRFALAATAAALSPSSYTRLARAVAVRQVYLTAWKILPGYLLAAAAVLVCAPAYAQKWRDLAERRRAHFIDLYRSGRWKHYYTNEEFLDHLGPQGEAFRGFIPSNRTSRRLHFHLP